MKGRLYTIVFVYLCNALQNMFNIDIAIALGSTVDGNKIIPIPFSEASKYNNFTLTSK